jgi:hypothetical protein
VQLDKARNDSAAGCGHGNGFEAVRGCCAGREHCTDVAAGHVHDAVIQDRADRVHRHDAAAQCQRRTVCGVDHRGTHDILATVMQTLLRRNWHVDIRFSPRDRSA